MIRDAHWPGIRNRAASILRFLERQAFSRNLQIGRAQNRVVRPFGDFDIHGRKPVRPSLVNVVIEAHRKVLVGGRVMDPLRSDRIRRDARVHFQRPPRPQSFANLIREHIGIASSRISFLRHLSRNLMTPVSIRRASDENRCDD